MMIPKLGFAAAACGALVLGATATAQNLENLRGEIEVDGSSTVYPITQAVAEEFGHDAPKVKVKVSISGTGGGFKRFAKGETDISNASRPIKAEEYEVAKTNGVEFIEIPVAYDGLSIVVNPSATFVDKLTVDDLKKIFLADSAAKYWSDVNPAWPHEEISIFAPGTDSGTFDYFKEVVAGDTGSIRSDMSVSEDDNVLVTGVARDPNAIGFFGAAYYFENKEKLRVVPIVNPETGKAVVPTPENIENGDYAPFSRPLFIYLNKKSAQRPEIKAFVEFYLEEGPDLVEDVGYVKLPESVYERAMKNFRTGRTGTHFLTESGEPLRGPVTKLYK